MPNKNENDKSKDLITPDPAVEDKITKMLDPTLPDEPAVKLQPEESAPTTAPEVNLEALDPFVKPDENSPPPSDDTAEEATASPAASEPNPEISDQQSPDSEQLNQDLAANSDPATEAPEESSEELPQIKDDPETIKAVEDIVAKDSDAILAAEDEKLAAAFTPQPKLTGGQKFKNFFKNWWKNPKSRYATIFIVLAIIIAAGVVPASRYFLLNGLGIRASTSVQVIDESTLQPLRNVTVRAGEVSAMTDDNGKATLQKLKLGPTEINIEKRAFAPESRRLTIGWGSNPQGEVKLRPTGTQYAFVLADYLSKKPIEKAEAISGEASAFSDAEGKLLLTMDDPSDEFEVQIISDGYRKETLIIDADSKDQESVRLVADRPHVFVSNRSGRFDIYKIDVDGQNEEMILEGTGHERADMALIPHDTQNLVALVSTRSGNRNADGFLLSSLTILDIDKDSTREVSSSEKIHVIGWHGDRLVYVKVAEGASAVSPDRHRLMSYDFYSGRDIEIAASNYFNDVMMIDGYIYYAPSALHQKGVNVSLFKVNTDGTNNEVVVDKEVWNIFRTSYAKLSLSLPGEWREYNINDGSLSDLEGEPANLTSRIYVNNPYNNQSLWVENRDGKGVLLAYDKQSGEDKILSTKSGLANPVFWLNKNTVVYRIFTNQETADYAVSLDGGEPQKIVDVANTSGIDSWYYY